MKQTLFEQINRMRQMSSLPLITEEVFYEQILNEDNRSDWLYKTYGDKVRKKYHKEFPSEDMITGNVLFYNLIRNDPTSIVDENAEEIKKTGKYSQWIIKVFLNSGKPIYRFMEDIYKIKEDLELYDRIKHRLPEDKRDINKISNEVVLYELVRPFKQEDLRSKSEKKGDIETVYEDENYHILIPKTREASCSWGEGTRWCTASPGLNYFEDYTEDGPLYIIIHKSEKSQDDQYKGEDARFQFHFESGQFMDVDDHRIELDKYFDTHPQVQKVFKQRFVKEKNLKNLLDIGEVELAFKLSNGDLSQFNSEQSLKLYHKKLIDDETMTKKWGVKDKGEYTEVFKNGDLYFIAGDWCNDGLYGLFDKDHEDFAKKLLCGDGYDLFDYHYDVGDLNNFWDNINEKNMKKIQELSIGLTTDDDVKITKSNINKIPTSMREDNSLYDLVNDNEDWDDIRDSIKNAVLDTQGLTDENAYFDGYTNLIVELLGPYEHGNNGLEFKIDDEIEWIDRFKQVLPEESIWDYSMMTIIQMTLGENNDLIQPRGEYHGWDKGDEIFNEQLDYRLSEL